MDALLAALTRAIEGAPGAALAAAAVWGVLSVVLSPCHLAGIPLLVAFVGGQPNLTTRRAFFLSAAFGVGVLITIAVLGLVTASLGRLAGDVGPAGTYLVAAVFFLAGLHLLEVIPLPLPAIAPAQMERRGVVAALALGLVFGIALGPCTFAFMAPVLGATFRAASSNVAYGAALLVAYGAGHCSVIVAAGTSTETVQRYLNWNQNSHAASVARKVCGVLLLVGGLAVLHGRH